MADQDMDQITARHGIPTLFTAHEQIRDFPCKIYSQQDRMINTIVHAHDYLQIWLICAGRCRHQINDRSAVLHGGDIFIVPPFVPHRVSTEQEEIVEIIGCEFTVRLLNADLPERFTSSPLFDYGYLEPFMVPAGSVSAGLHLDRTDREFIESLFRELLLDYSAKPPFYDLSIKANVLRLLVRLARIQHAADPGRGRLAGRQNRDALSAALAYIHQNYTQEIYIRELCSIALMSRSRFSAAFLHLTGKTAVDYVNCLRIQKAQGLLADAALNMNDICERAGFSDASYFARVFRKATGRSPREYRKTILTGE